MHQERICFCPPELPAGYFGYGTRRHAIGRPPKWLLQKGTVPDEDSAESLGDPENSAESLNPLVTQAKCLLNPLVTQKTLLNPLVTQKTLLNPLVTQANESLGPSVKCLLNPFSAVLGDQTEPAADQLRPRTDGRYSLRERVRAPERLIC